MQAEYEGDHALLYDAYGRLTYLGTGPDIWANLSTVHLLHTSLLDESIRCARRAIELAPRHPRANLNLGIALAMTGEVEEARRRLKAASTTLPSESLREQARRWLDTLGPAEGGSGAPDAVDD
jgi:tetratricopeptide (TPR) repeat protein